MPRSIKSIVQGLQGAEVERLRALRKPVGVRLADADGPTPITPVARGGRLPLSFAQQRLWFLDQLEGPSATYIAPTSLRLTGQLDVGAWRRSLNALFARHEALRSIFVTRDGRAEVQLLDPGLGLPLVQNDLRGVLGAETQATQLSEQEFQAPFDLARGPLIRARLIRLGEEDHLFLLTQHHIISDGWSMGVMLRELSTLYGAYREGLDNPLPSLKLQYPDYACWQRQMLGGERLSAQRDYWRAALADAPVLLALPTDRPRPPEQDFAGDVLPIEIGDDLSSGLKSLAQRHGATLFATLLAAWAAVLGRLSGHDQVVIGAPTANRARRELEPVVGFFTNTLALKVDLAGDPTLAELIARTRNTILGAQDHQDLPFEQVVELVNPPRSLNHAPLFQVLFAWQSDEGKVVDLPGLKAQPILKGTGKAKFDLNLTLSESDGVIVGLLGYATALFDAASVQRYRAYLMTMLEAMVADDAQRVLQVDLIAADERTRLLQTWSIAAPSHPKTTYLHQMFEGHAAANPTAVAVVGAHESLTYGELNVQANRLAHHLVALGVKPDGRVAICLERSPEMVVALLATFKAGGAYVPLDPAYPAERLSFLLGDSAPSVVLSHGLALEALRPALLELRCSPIVLDLASEEAAWSCYPEGNPDPASLGLARGHLAYVIYTSGSTGTPKGVMVEHACAANTVPELAERGCHGIDVGIAMSASASFDISIFQMMAPLISGGRLVLMTDDSLAEPSAFWRKLAQERVDLVSATPSHMRALADAAPPGTHLTRLGLGGEEVTAQLVERLRQSLRIDELANAYGPTEATICATAFRIAADDEPPSPVPIGRPIANARVYILDGGLEPVPTGVCGELYIAGPGLARGYLNRAGFTAERFVACPWAGPGARMYRTGDLARWRADGELHFLGRADNQTKIRGFRVELGEIEARLLEHPAVREAVITTLDDGVGGKRLVAYVVPTGLTGDSDHGELTARLRAHLLDCLPNYMAPTTLVALEAMPLTPSGKLDRNALPAPTGDGPAKTAYEPPQDDIEATLAAIWAELLGVARVGRHDNYFDLGGDSIKSIQVSARALAQGLRLSVRDIITHQSIALIAATIERINTPPWRAEDDQVTGEAPLTPIQQRFCESRPQSVRNYNIGFSLHCSRRLDSALLGSAVSILLARHDALGARLSSAPQSTLIYGGTTPAATVATLVSSKAHTEPVIGLAREPSLSVDPFRGPMVAFALVEHADHVQSLFVQVHHFVADPISVSIIINDLEKIYLALEARRAVDLGPKRASFKRWAQALAAYPATPDALPEARYWGSMPWTQARQLWPQAESHDGDASPPIEIKLSPRFSNAILKAGPKLYGVGASEIILTCILRTAQHRYGGDCFRADLVSNGRLAFAEQGDLSDTVGWFTCEYPLILRCASDADFAVAARAVASQIGEVPHAGATYAAMAGATTDFARAPPGLLRFNFLGSLGGAGQRSNLFSAPVAATDDELGSSAVVGSPDDQVKLDVHEASGQLSLGFTMPAKLRTGEAERFVRSLRNELESRSAAILLASDT